MNLKVLTGTLIVLLIVFATSYFISLNNRPVETGKNDLIITLDRGSCFGTCPVYKLTIYGNGDVIYEGSDFEARGIKTVKISGIRTTTISKEKVRELVSEFDKINYLALADSYEKYSITDAQTVITSITNEGKTKTIKHYHGDRSAPEELTAIENKIDDMVNSDQWVK